MGPLFVLLVKSNASVCDPLEVLKSLFHSRVGLGVTDEIRQERREYSEVCQSAHTLQSEELALADCYA